MTGGVIDRKVKPEAIITTNAMRSAGLTGPVIAAGITFAYDILARIDDALSSAGTEKLVDIVELASFSAMLGNLIRHGITRASKGKFKHNKPHAYPDLLAASPDVSDIEIKIALENNAPKGHLAKRGNYLTFRYVLGNRRGHYKRGKENRGNVPWIWEVKFGCLEEKDFNISNTEGDSGKTAYVSAPVRKKLDTVFVDNRFKPYGRSAPA